MARALYAPGIYRDYFKQNLDPEVGVAKDVPAVRPRKLVVVTSVPAGGTDKPRVLTWRRLIVQCWARDEESTAELCEDIRELVVDSPKVLSTIHKVAIVGEPGRFDDPDDTSPRFQMTFDALLKTVASGQTRSLLKPVAG